MHEHEHLGSIASDLHHAATLLAQIATDPARSRDIRLTTMSHILASWVHELHHLTRGGALTESGEILGTGDQYGPLTEPSHGRTDDGRVVPLFSDPLRQAGQHLAAAERAIRQAASGLTHSPLTNEQNALDDISTQLTQAATSLTHTRADIANAQQHDNEASA